MNFGRADVRPFEEGVFLPVQSADLDPSSDSGAFLEDLLN